MGESSKKEKKSKKEKEPKKDKKVESPPPPKEEAAPAPKEEAAAAPAAPKDEPKRAGRATSNVFAMFKQAQIQEFKEAKKNPLSLFKQNQIQEFKEAFTMMDNDRDGLLNESDLASIYDQIGRSADPKVIKEMIKEAPSPLNFTGFLTMFGEKLGGRDPDPKMLDEMLGEAPGPLNFTMFLTLFGDKLKGTDPERTLLDAFRMFDEAGTGYLEEEYVKDLLMNVGDQFNKDELKATWKEAPIEGGKLDYKKFVILIKRGKDEEGG